MTLLEQCEQLANLFVIPSELHEYFYEHLERLCLQQQAVGLREAVAITEQHHAKDHWYMQWVREQCEQRAREREGA